MKSLRLELDSISSRISAYTSGLSLFPPLSSSTFLDTPSLYHVDNCLRLLDSYLLGLCASSDEEEGLVADKLRLAREDGLGTALVSLCVACEVASHDHEYIDQTAIASRCLESALRVLINLTHDNLPWCQALLDEPFALLTIVRLVVTAQPQPVEASEKVKRENDDDTEVEEDSGDDVTPLLDRLCLALGVLTNIVQVSHEAKEMTRDTLLDTKCTGKRGCIKACKCTSRQSALGCLAEVYLRRHKSDNDFDSVIRGHMAVLFGLLMQNCPENQHVLLRTMPGISDRRKLGLLVEHAREFTLFYVEFTKKVMMAVSRQSREGDEGENDAEKLDPSAVAGARAVLHDTQGETVAKRVLSFLEDLRDSRRS